MGKLLGFILTLIGFIAVVAFAALEIHVWLTYGNAPVGEIPTWALYLMFKN